MNAHRFFTLIVGSCGVVAVLAGFGAPVLARQTEPVTYTMPRVGDPPYPLEVLDPQISPGPLFVDGLFLGLTGQNPVTETIEPEFATDWEISANGLVWTFTLRDDVPWVRWDPVAGELETLRMVTAHDVVYSIQRVCDPRTGQVAYVEVVSRLIQGCATVAQRPPTEVDDADLEDVGVRALDDQTVEIHLAYAAGYFQSLASLLYLRPVPREVIDEYGAEWTEPGVIVTNGPFVLESWRPDQGVYTLLHNPLLPDDLRGPGNVERVVVVQYDTGDAMFEAYLNDQLDLGGIPAGYEDMVEADDALAAQQVVSYYPFIWYFGMANDQPPLDNVHVRRAFSAAFNRDRFSESSPGWLMMTHFTPPGVFGAPPIDEVGVGYDPEYARAQLALAGYPGCEGLPPILAATWEGGGSWFTDYLWADFETVLGCDPALLHVEELPGWQAPSLADPDNPAELRPHMWMLGWQADYPDANSFLGDLLGCDGVYDGLRPCSEVDDLITQAAVETDPLVRKALYRDIEERLFGPQGEVPLIPISTSYGVTLVKPWLSGPLFSGTTYPYDWYTIDQAAQLAARGG